jgi:hypothetical protein
MNIYVWNFLGKKLFFFEACLLFAIGVPIITSAQSLSKGDIAFVGFNADRNKDFAIVVLHDIPANTTIYFTDQTWNGTEFDDGNNDLEWNTGSGVIPAGIVITFNELNTTHRSPSIGSFTGGQEMSLSSAGGVLFAYTGTAERDPALFLAAISTKEDDYNGTGGTLNGTGLTQGKEAVLLQENYDVGQYTGDHSGNTKQGYLLKIANTDDNWLQDNGNGDQSGEVLSFNTQAFTVVHPPTVQFAVAADTVSENVGNYQLSVTLVQSNNTAVSVDVVFQSGASSATSNDISGYSTKAIHFTSTDPDGTTKSVSIFIHNDNQYNESRTAIFQLQSISTGAIIKPKVFSLTILSAPVVINEILADPPSGTAGDANGDGTRDGSEDEFIELVNSSSNKIDISGWKLSDDSGSTIRHIFPDGTVLDAKQTVVVFGGGSPAGSFGGAIVQTASTGILSLNNGGDDPTLLDKDGNIIQHVHYDSEGNDAQSLTRDPDIMGSFVEYTDASDANSGKLFSPGTKVDGSSFGTGYATAFHGHEGWRFIAAPTKNTAFMDLLGELWTQGIKNSDAPTVSQEHANIYRWSEPDTSFRAISGMNQTMTPGKGYILYVYQDDDLTKPGIQGGFPKIISTNKDENSSVMVAVSSNDADGDGSIDGNEGYSLLGNPYGTDISVDKVMDALQKISSNVNANVYIWNPNKGNGNGGYMTKTSGTIAPFQAFFIRYMKPVSGNVSFTKPALATNKGTNFYGNANMSLTPKEFRLFLGNGRKFDTYQVHFQKNGAIGTDRLDAYKLFSLNANPIELYSIAGDGAKLAKKVLPPLQSLKEKVQISLKYSILVSGSYKFRWSDVDNLPQNVQVYLIDHTNGQKINLRTSGQYQFQFTKGGQPKVGKLSKSERHSPVISKAANEEKKSRFELLIVPSSSNEDPKPGKQIQETKMLPNYPNPFSSQTTVKMQLKKKCKVTVIIYNIVGQKIATLVENKMMPKGIHEMNWQMSSNMPSGVYICWMKAGNKVLTQKMTYIK